LAFASSLSCPLGSGLTASGYKKRPARFPDWPWELSHYLNEISAVACLCCYSCPLSEAYLPSEAFLAFPCAAAPVDAFLSAEAVQPGGPPADEALARAAFRAAEPVPDGSHCAEPFAPGLAAERSPVASPVDELAPAEVAEGPAVL